MKALAQAVQGDTIYLRGGTYTVTQTLQIDKSNLTLASYPGERATIVGSTTDTDNLTSIIFIGASSVSLVDLEIAGGSYYGVKVSNDLGVTPTSVRISGCIVRDTGRDCIKTFNVDDLLIENCEVGPSGVRDSSNAEGIDIMASVGATVRNCYIHDTATAGLWFKAGTRGGVVENCRVENTGNSGILLGQDSGAEYMRDGAVYEAIDCTARNNIIVNTSAAGIGTYAGYNVRFYNNTLINVAKIYQAGFYVVPNSRGVQSERVVFKNNIVVVDVNSERPLIHTVNLNDQLVCDWNIWFSPRGSYQFWRESSSSNAYNYWQSLSSWQQGTNADWNSQTVDPKLDSANLYKPRGDSPAINRGEILTDVATDYSGITRPQGSTFDVGAHEIAAAELKKKRR
jgi:hypothetical protein